jgi:hypothetical protein
MCMEINMKKLMVLAMMATLLMAGSAFAAHPKSLTPNATFQFGVGGAASGPTTTNNDDSCDISVAPAATLLLPYFEVDFNSPQSTARTTLFTITNTSDVPQIAHVTVWTDWSFPILDFNIFLTGYDVQSINLYDMLNRGVIAPGTPPGTSIDVDPPDFVATAGSDPLANTANPNFLPTAASRCAAGLLPGNIPPTNLSDLRTALTTGLYSGCGTTRVGGTHTNAIGYITMDVAATCSTSLPTTSSYFSTEILFDNVLIGDYQDINPNATTGNYAGGNPLVHIRAIPEGGPAGSIPAPSITNLPYTYYDRYTAGPLAARTIDRRQPLPSTFAARYIQGGTGDFTTRYKMWREGVTGASLTCSTFVQNSNLPIAEVVRFDEHENSFIPGTGVVISPPPPGQPGTAETQAILTSSSLFPQNSGTADIAGWMYLNLNNLGSLNYSSQRPGFNGPATSTTVGSRQSQNWVIVSMFAEGRYSVDFDAAWLGNGCSPSPAAGTTIGPAGGTPVCPSGVAGCTPGVAPYIGTNNTP